MMTIAVKRAFLSILWLGLLIYAFGFSPQDEKPTIAYIIQIMQFRTDIIDPWIIAVFNLLGVWPMIMAAILLIDSQGQKLPAWPFVLGSCVLGNFILFPYLILRSDNPTFSGNKTILVKAADSKFLALMILAATLYLIYLGFSSGNIDNFVNAFKVNSLVNIMSMDFLLFFFGFPAILADDMRRRCMSIDGRFWAFSLVPVLGPAVYLVMRPKLLT